MLSYALEGTTALLTMDDGKANALSNEMIDALSAALDRAAKEAGAVILQGRPERFCAGFDLKVMMSGFDNATALLTRGSALLMKLYGLSVPLVIACTGHALAGGALMLLTGDRRFGTAGNYRIGLNEVAIGLPVPILAMELARDRIISSDLARATLMATIYGPEDAMRVGYLDSISAAADVLPRAREEAAKLAELPKQAFAATKRRLRGKTIAHIEATLQQDMKEIAGGGNSSS